MTFKQAPAGSRSPRGQLVKNLQTSLTSAGFSTQGVDGKWGNDTTTAVKHWQTNGNVVADGVVDDPQWLVITGSPAPSLLDRALQIVAAWEGTGFDLANGNFDGAGITWGIVGFTWYNGELQGILNEIHTNSPTVFSDAFGTLEPKLLTVLAQPRADQMDWADSITAGTSGERLVPAWADAFAKLGNTPEAQAVQMHRVERYWNRAKTDALALGLNGNERGLGLCFDIAVQNGGLDASELSEIKNSGTTATALLKKIAEVVADNSKPKYRADVLSRKLTFATGKGTVHGDKYDLSCWGV